MLIFENVHGLILWAVCDGGICSSMFTVTQTNVSAGKRKCCEVLESVSALCVCRKGSKPIGRMICKFVFLCVDFIMYVSHLLLVHSYSSIYRYIFVCILLSFILHEKFNQTNHLFLQICMRIARPRRGTLMFKKICLFSRFLPHELSPFRPPPSPSFLRYSMTFSPVNLSK